MSAPLSTTLTPLVSALSLLPAASTSALVATLQPDFRLACDHCQRRFSSQKSFDMHKPCNDKGKQYVCPEPGCAKVYKDGPALGLHRRLKHPKGKDGQKKAQATKARLMAVAVKVRRY
ncbi:hypothetical protein JCM3770_006423 [Rhodotorula araucariae]